MPLLKSPVKGILTGLFIYDYNDSVMRSAPDKFEYRREHHTGGVVLVIAAGGLRTKIHQPRWILSPWLIRMRLSVCGGWDLTIALLPHHPLSFRAKSPPTTRRKLIAAI